MNALLRTLKGVCTFVGLPQDNLRVFQLTVVSGHLDCAKFLLAAGAQPQCPTDVRDLADLSVLMRWKQLSWLRGHCADGVTRAACL